MNYDVQVFVASDTASPEIEKLKDTFAGEQIRREVATACVKLTKDYLNNLPPNKRNWPTTGFYKGASRGTTWEPTADGIVIMVDNEEAKGAMKFRYHGGTINMKDKLLTIPARAEFYGHRAGEFTNLRFVMFASGAKALVIGKGGTSIVNFGTGTEKMVKGAGARTAMMVAYWLVESVTQDGNHLVIPDSSVYYEAALNAVVELFSKRHKQ